MEDINTKKNKRISLKIFFCRYRKIKKYSVVLDLDGTLVHTLEHSEAYEIERTHGPDYMSHLIKNFQKLTLDDENVIFLRPHLDTFLDHLFENYNVSVWSAGTPDYVHFIARHIILTKPSRKLEFVFTRDECVRSIDMGSSGEKNLRLVWDAFRHQSRLNYECNKLFHPENTYLIDNTPSVAVDHVNNFIEIPTFDVRHPHAHHDTEFFNIMEQLSSICW